MKKNIELLQTYSINRYTLKSILLNNSKDLDFNQYNETIF